MTRLLAAAALLFAFALPAGAQEYFDIDVDVAEYPEMVPIPDSPVYYAPRVDSNYFFYDGLYWGYYNDGWYSSHWYNGPWSYVDPIYVPTYILWVPIRYYRRPPHYFHGWRHDRPPRWAERWGRDWQARHNHIFRGGHRHNTRAPLPEYQRNFNRGNYPRGAQQQNQLHSQNYGYRPQEGVVRQHYERRGMGVAQGQGQAPQRLEAPQRAEPQRSEPANPTARGGGEPRREERGSRDRDRR